MLLGALLDMDEPPTAVLATTDLVASACSTWPTAGGGRFQTSCRWSGYDDILIAAHTVPALTTLRMPIAEIVAEGVQTAIELARDPTEPRAPRLRPFEPTLIVRQSTAPPRADSESPELSPGVALG
jgi:DNA-binding LacI/PurR family transcriptional regulator